MKYVIRSDAPLPLTPMENDAVMSALQNIALLCSTRRGTCPGYRDFGLPMAWLHRPAAAAEAIAAAEIGEAIERFEPRATFVDCALIEADNDEKYILQVEVEI